ncbi:hypothetical protein E2562_025575 [Oryza meyeriana var. granulata]|uniref:Uncharacterized protein n=1 Tax=Oryza meyeriana var. granulata TaxID=110450 RepID=A0A6G1E1T6_9ORYZ|nr:hypothetical protein E2562_025575 [Oryza meyeriana var. granulata]
MVRANRLGDLSMPGTVFGPMDSAPCIADVPQVTVPATGSDVGPSPINPKHQEVLGAISYPVTLSSC